MSKTKTISIEENGVDPQTSTGTDNTAYLHSYTRYLYYMGLWTKRSYWPGISPFFFFYVPAYTFFFVISLIELAHNWGDLNAMTETVDMTLIFAVTGYKVVNVMWDEKEWKRIVQVVGNNFNRPARRVKPEDGTIMEDSVRSNRAWGIMWSMLVCSMLSAFTIRPMIENALRKRSLAKSSSLDLNFTDDTAAEPNLWHLPYRTWSPFDNVTGIIYVLVYALHVFIAVMQIVFVPVFDMFMIAMINYTCGQFRILQKELQNIRQDSKTYLAENGGRGVSQFLLPEALDQEAKEDEDTEASAALDGEMTARVKDHVKHHETMLQFCVDLEGVVNRQLLSHFLCTSFIVCTSAFQLANRTGETIKLITYAQLLVCAMFEMGMFCYFCDRLIQESTLVGYAVYCCEWYYPSTMRVGSLPFRRSASIIMSRALRPCYITFGRFTELSMETYAGILRISFTYFTVLNGVNE